MCNFLVLFFLALEVLCECPAAQGRCGSVSTVLNLYHPLWALQAGFAHAVLTSIPNMGKAGVVLSDRPACLMLPEHSKDVFPVSLLRSWQVSAVLTENLI